MFVKNDQPLFIAINHGQDINTTILASNVNGSYGNKDWEEIGRLTLGLGHTLITCSQNQHHALFY